MLTTSLLFFVGLILMGIGFCFLNTAFKHQTGPAADDTIDTGTPFVVIGGIIILVALARLFVILYEIEQSWK